MTEPISPHKSQRMVSGMFMEEVNECLGDEMQ